MVPKVRSLKMFLIFNSTFKIKEYLPSRRSLSSLLASRLSLLSCRSISWLILFCSFASSERQHAMIQSASNYNRTNLKVSPQNRGVSLVMINIAWAILRNLLHFHSSECISNFSRCCLAQWPRSRHQRRLIRKNIILFTIIFVLAWIFQLNSNSFFYS